MKKPIGFYESFFAEQPTLYMCLQTRKVIFPRKRIYLFVVLLCECVHCASMPQHWLWVKFLTQHHFFSLFYSLFTNRSFIQNNSLKRDTHKAFLSNKTRLNRTFFFFSISASCSSDSVFFLSLIIKKKRKSYASFTKRILFFLFSGLFVAFFLVEPKEIILNASLIALVRFVLFRFFFRDSF